MLINFQQQLGSNGVYLMYYWIVVHVSRFGTFWITSISYVYDQDTRYIAVHVSFSDLGLSEYMYHEHHMCIPYMAGGN